MKKFYLLFIFIMSCSSVANTDIYKESNIELTYENLNGNLITEDLSDKSTIIIFWADY